jgi:hypothetical protein
MDCRPNVVVTTCGMPNYYKVRRRVIKQVTHGYKNVKHVIFEYGNNSYFSTYPPSTLIHSSHPFTSALKPAA